MPTTKPAKAPKNVSTKPFSLVPADAQRRMYEALRGLKPGARGTSAGCEVAEIAACVAIDEHDPVILAYAARGARKARKQVKLVRTQDRRFESATIAAVTTLIGNPKATAVICAGKLGTGSAARKDYSDAFDFAARHKLPILFLVADTLPPKRPEADLRVLSAEFGIPAFSVDANDAIAAYRVTTEALHHARHHRGPSVIATFSMNRDRSALDLLHEYMERHGNWPL